MVSVLPFQQSFNAYLLSNATVVVLKANDVVFTQVAAALDFDHDQCFYSFVFKAVFVARRDVGGLVAFQVELFVAIQDTCVTTDNDPVFAAMVVHLQ